MAAATHSIQHQHEEGHSKTAAGSAPTPLHSTHSRAACYSVMVGGLVAACWATWAITDPTIISSQCDDGGFKRMEHSKWNGTDYWMCMTSDFDWRFQGRGLEIPDNAIFEWSKKDFGTEALEEIMSGVGASF